MFALAGSAIVFLVIGSPQGMVINARPIKTVKQVFDLSTIGGGHKRFGMTILVLFGLFYLGNAGREHTFHTWLFTYSVESDLKFSKQEAALLDAANKGSFMLGRLISTPISHFAPIQPMLFTEIYTVMILVMGLATLGTRSKIYLWVFSCLVNGISSPIWPGCLSWTDKYIPVTAIIMVVMRLGTSGAGFFFQWLTGYLFTYQHPDDVMYVLVDCTALICVLIVIMQIIASRKGNRYDRALATNVDEVLDVKPPSSSCGRDNIHNNTDIGEEHTYL